MVGARWQCYLSSATGLSNSPPLARGCAAGGLVGGELSGGAVFVPRQEIAVIALAKPTAPQCAGGKVTVADEFTIESCTVQGIRVRQLRHSHRYIFTVQKLRGHRILWAGQLRCLR